MAVEPGDGTGYVVEDDAFRDEEVQFVHVEPSVGGTVQAAERGGQAIRYGVRSFVEPGGEGDGCRGDDDAGGGYRPVEVDGVREAVAADEFTEGYEPGDECYRGEEDEGQGHALRGLVRGVFVGAFFAPEYVVVEAEHVECRQGRDEAHHDAEHGAEHEGGREYFVFTEEPGEGGYTRDGEAGDEEGGVRDGQIFAKSAHVAHLVAVDGVDDGSRAEE